MTTRKPEDLTLEEVKEQMSLYQRLYYYKAKDSPEHVEAIFWKETRARRTKETGRKHKWWTPMKDMRKYKKDLNDAYITV